MACVTKTNRMSMNGKQVRVLAAEEIKIVKIGNL